MRTLLAFIAALILTVPLSALECFELPVNKAFEMSDVVLLGRVTAARYVTVPETIHAVVTIEVSQIWKGTTSKHVELYQPAVLGGINFPESIGVEFVLFARILTPQIRALRNLPPTTAPGLIAFECLSKPAQFVDLRVLGRPIPNP